MQWEKARFTRSETSRAVVCPVSLSLLPSISIVTVCTNVGDPRPPQEDMDEPINTSAASKDWGTVPLNTTSSSSHDNHLPRRKRILEIHHVCQTELRRSYVGPWRPARPRSMHVTRGFLPVLARHHSFGTCHDVDDFMVSCHWFPCTHAASSSPSTPDPTVGPVHRSSAPVSPRDPTGFVGESGTWIWISNCGGRRRRSFSSLGGAQ